VRDPLFQSAHENLPAATTERNNSRRGFAESSCHKKTRAGFSPRLGSTLCVEIDYRQRGRQQGRQQVTVQTGTWIVWATIWQTCTWTSRSTCCGTQTVYVQGTSSATCRYVVTVSVQVRSWGTQTV
jgi:hypothetical protein